MPGPGSLLRSLLQAARGVFRRDAVTREIDDEIRHFTDEAAREYERRGWSPEAAARAARVDLGSSAAVRDEVRSSTWDAPLRALGRDVRYGLRLLRRSPGFTTLSVLLLALGIGATTALFSVADELLFRPLPVRAPHELVILGWTTHPPAPRISVPVGVHLDEKTGESRSTGFSYFMFQALQSQGDRRTLAGILAFTGAFPVPDPGSPDDMATGQMVSGNYFELLGVGPRLGRVLTRDDDRPGAPPVAVISHRYWDRRFGRAENVIGRTIQVDALSPVIVGVTPAGFAGTQDLGSAPDISMPIAITSSLAHTGPKNANRMVSEPMIWGFRLMGRMRAGATPDQVKTELQAPFQTSAVASFGAGTAANVKAPDLYVMEGSQGLSTSRHDMAQFVLTLSLVVGLVLLIVCANFASLLYARGEARRAELSVRRALGATRGALLRQLLTESLVVSTLGGAAGVWCAWWGKDSIFVWLTRVNPRFVFEPQLDARVLAFALVAALVTGLGVALAPGLRATRVEPHEALKKAGWASGRHRTTLGRTLLAAEIGMAVVLVVLAGLFTRTMHNLSTTNLGVDADHLLWFGVRQTLPPGMKDPRGSGPANGPTFVSLVDKVSSLPGVQSVAYAQYPLINGERAMPFLAVPGRPKAPDEDRTVYYEGVSPNFFRTVGMPVVLGRDFTEDDRSHTLAIVNETLARTYFAGSPIGQRIGISKDPLVPVMAATDLVEIVGVVRDAKYMTVRDSALPGVFVSGMLPGAGTYVARTAADPAVLVPAIRPALAEFTRFTVSDVRTQADQAARTFERERHFASVSSAFGGLALLLTGIGLYGLLSYSVARRTREIGLRIAIGASRGQIMRSIVRETLVLTTVGVALGVAGAAMASRIVQSQLFGLAPTDAASMAVAVTSMFAMAVLAAFVPARRAVSVDPLDALRSE